MKRPRVGSKYIFDPSFLDRIDGRSDAQPGDAVRVCRPCGCPPPGTMGHCHIETLDGRFLGLVCVSSLTRYVKAPRRRDSLGHLTTLEN